MNSELESKFLWVYSQILCLESLLEMLTAVSLNFSKFLYCLESEQLRLPTYFFKYTFQQQTLSHFSISFKYYFFILSLIFIYSFFNISLCIPNYNIFLISNNYIFKSSNGNILKFFNNHTFQWFFLMTIFFMLALFFIYQIYISLEIYQIYVIWNEFMH